MKYYHFYWNEDPGDEWFGWETSNWYFEINDDLWTKRQIEIYEKGHVLFYDDEHWSDQYGMLTDKQLEDTTDLTEITKQEFERIWDSYKPINRP